MLAIFVTAVVVIGGVAVLRRSRLRNDGWERFVLDADVAPQRPQQPPQQPQRRTQEYCLARAPRGRRAGSSSQHDDMMGSTVVDGGGLLEAELHGRDEEL